jgi:selenocysteine lyase/cysteine desulfurase
MWREGICEVIEVNLNSEGFLDLSDLEKKVSDKKYDKRYKIGSFSAASNVTGTITPVYDIAKIMHKHNALALFDYAASAPYVEINMNKDSESYLDAVFISPHKFLGGPGSCGVLVLNERLYDKSLSPTFAAGGTVDYVSSFAYDFTKDVEAREKPGTPGVLQVIKAALCIQLKKEVGIDKIEKKEYEYTKRALVRLSRHPNIEILGTKDPHKRVSIFSMIIKHKDRYLHPKLATVLLNDLFGIQSRAGCSCAGPYGHRLLSIDKDTSNKFRDAILKGYNCVKPGWLRVNFHYVMNEADFNFVCEAIEFIADYGYLFINEYKMNLYDGSWIHKDFEEDEYLIKNFGISDIINNYDNSNTIRNSEIDREAEYRKYINEALKISEELKKNNIENYKTTGIKSVDELSTFYFSEVY